MEYFLIGLSGQVTIEEVFSILSDRHSVNILKTAYSGLKATPSSYHGNISKKQFYVRLKRLKDMGLINKRDGFYRTTTLGSLLCNGFINMMETVTKNYWSLKAVDVLKAKKDFPLRQKESVIEEIIRNSNLRDVVNATHLSGFSVIKDYNHTVVEVTKLLENAKKEVYLATRYHDPSFSARLFKKIASGLNVHMIDSLPEQISVENRLAAVLRTPPNKDTLAMVKKIIKSPKFDLRRRDIPTSFMVVDGTSVCYEIVTNSNPEQFTLGISHYDDPYLAERFISYYNILARDAVVPKLIQDARDG